jgi:hypothetical protein
MHVAAQPIELCDGDGAFLAAGLFQRGGELRPAIERMYVTLRANDKSSKRRKSSREHLSCNQIDCAVLCAQQPAIQQRFWW